VTRRTNWLLLGVVAVATLAPGYVACWRGVVWRRVHRAADSPYRRELCAPWPAVPAPTRVYSDPEPGDHYVPSPDGRHLAFSRDAAWAYRTLSVWNEQDRRLRAVVSIREADPGSGRSHDYGWSRDSRALLISGRGALPLRRVVSVAYVYVPAEDVLYEVEGCRMPAG
jgi:hypothetical protein